MSVFAERLKELRLKRGENQSDIAKILGVSTQSYSAYEGAREPKYDFLCQLAKHYNTTVDYLIGFSDYPKTETSALTFERPAYCKGCMKAELSLETTTTLYTDNEPCETHYNITCKHDKACKRIYEMITD